MCAGLDESSVRSGESVERYWRAATRWKSVPVRGVLTPCRSGSLFFVVVQVSGLMCCSCWLVRGLVEELQSVCGDKEENPYVSMWTLWGIRNRYTRLMKKKVKKWGRNDFIALLVAAGEDE